RAIYKVNSDAEFPTSKEAGWFTGGQIIHDQLSQWHPLIPVVLKAAEQVEGLLIGGVTVAIHCTHGRDRTGLLVGAWELIYAKRSIDDVLTEFATFGAVGLVAVADKNIVACLQAIAGGARA